jgi:hypothetical protein
MDRRSKRSTRRTPRSPATPESPRRRGRPPKFGSPSQVVALTLPEEVLEALSTLNPDPGWAIVELVRPMLHAGKKRPRIQAETAVAELAHLPGRRSLIVVQPHVFSSLRGVSVIPLADGRAFLAMDGAGGIADLELAILDQLETTPATSPEHRGLVQARDVIRKWRTDPSIVVRTKSIIVVEGPRSVPRVPLTNLGVLDGEEGAALDRQSSRTAPPRP